MFNPSVRRGTTGVVGKNQHEPDLAIMVGAWFPAGNVPRVGLRQFSSGRCCTGRGWALVFFFDTCTREVVEVVADVVVEVVVEVVEVVGEVKGRAKGKGGRRRTSSSSCLNVAFT